MFTTTLQNKTDQTLIIAPSRISSPESLGLFETGIMASISKFSTALLSVPNEITVAAANFNLNFSLMKVEAPPEFHGLRDVLSHRRRREAEEGVQHVTARCLGALFESLIPHIPYLTAAYGNRVSEISKLLNPASLPAGMFADRAGADGTSIWAAATSGQYAIAVHLLACMLARIWKPAEAISLWVELVERRKQEIFKAYNTLTATGIPSIMAAQQLFTRDQLSAWDASARSWLQAADSAKRLDQTQLMLIINNVHMPVNTNKEPFESVVAAWTSGMNTMERLICGTPQRVQDGAILVAITAWHLYPNMQVLSDRAKDINPGDKLMARSMLTVSSFKISDAREGVFWSLPLSRMRYYSPPVITERSLASDTSRISIEEFQIVFLGAFVARWKRICSDDEICCKLIVSLHNAYERLDTAVPPWFKILSDAASHVINSSGYLQAQNRKLLKLGSRRCAAFLHDPDYEPPAMFGLEYFHVLIRCLTDVEARIRFLRHGAELRTRGKSSKLLLRYKTQSPNIGNSHRFATVLPSMRTSQKRPVGQEPIPSPGYKRFAVGLYEKNESLVRCHGLVGCGCTDPAMGECICAQHLTECTIDCHPDIDMCNNTRGKHSLLSFECQRNCSDDRPCVGCLNERRQCELADEGEEAFLIHPEALTSIDDFQFIFQAPGEEVSRTYGLWLGHGQIAAIFEQQEGATYDTYLKDVSDMPSATIEEIEAIVNSKWFDPTSLELWSCCYHWSGKGLRQQTCSLLALTLATNIYKSMTDSTVSIEVINSTMYSTSWATSIEFESIQISDPHSMWWHNDGAIGRTSPRIAVPLASYTRMAYTSKRPSDASIHVYNDYFAREARRLEYLTDDTGEGSRSSFEEETHNLNQMVYQYCDADQVDTGLQLKRAFSCIAWFDSGEFDIPLKNLNAVMALANGASIYVASELLVDPSASTAEAPIQRLFGNLGRSEMSLLVPPADPRLANPDVRSWKLINHSAFDGKFQDCFGGTSLHLTFTESEDTVYVGSRGLRDRQVILMEALVSIDDRGRSIGDLDILSMFTNSDFYVLEKCAHTSDQDVTSAAGWDLTAVDCWEEFLDPPSGTAIFRANGNWEARLAAAAAAIQMGKKVLVLPETACLHCLMDCTQKHIDVVIA
jgi:hypothetical protein